ncbi:PAS domain-containing protein [bacterium]|nr:PAS domain-containing protein [bacterium]
MVDGAGFKDRFLSKLDRLDPDQIQNYLTHLLGQKQLMQTVFDHLDEGIVVTDPNLRMLFINRRARAMLGMSRQRSIVGDDLIARMPNDHALASTVESLRGHPRTIESYESSYGPNDQRTVSITTLLMRDPAAADDEENQLLILILRDVTDRVQRESEKARARRLISMATLTSGIAHEIKNPLNSINIHAQQLEIEIENARERGASEIELAPFNRASRVILEETSRLARIVDEFLLAARPISPTLEPLDLRVIFGQLDRIFRPECDRCRIELRMSSDPDLPPVMMDAHLMLQALRNLVRNAIDALCDPDWRNSRTAEFVPRVLVESRLSADAVQIIIEDNGPGIPEGTLEHIFEPYFTTKPSGTGLGLMVVYRIVAEHHGAMHVDTHPGEGSRFIISLPLHQKPIRLLSQGEPQASPVAVQGKKKR